MNSKVLSVGLMGLTVVALAVPNTPAHNPYKYTNIPFVVAAACPSMASTASSKFVSSGGQLKLLVNSPPTAFAGFEVFCASPASGRLPINPQGNYGQGAITFNEVGLPAGAGTVAYVQNYFPNIKVAGIFTQPVNGMVTMPVRMALSPTAVLNFVQVYLDVQGTPIICSNFRFNNQQLLADTTFIDTTPGSVAGDGSYCQDGP